MASKNINSKEGFTIIEVVLVLAIAGLIFLMVFIALPALQRSQRDTSRRNDMSRVDTSLVQYQTNNSSSKNNLPEGPSYWAGAETFGDNCGSNVACSFVQRYMNSGTDTATNTFEDPDGSYYSMAISSNIENADPNFTSPAAVSGDATNGWTLTTDFNDHIVYIFPGGQCDGEKVMKSTKRHFAILYRLEGAGIYCIDDQ